MHSKRLYPLSQPTGSPANLFRMLSPSLSYKKLIWDSNVGHTDKTRKQTLEEDQELPVEGSVGKTIKPQTMQMEQAADFKNASFPVGKNICTQQRSN